MIRDLRHFTRQILQNPGFVLIAVVSLALGIGATTAIFSVVYAALINPYPYPAADRIVRLTAATGNNDNGGDWINLNSAQVRQFAQSPVVESVLAIDFHAMLLTGRDYPDNVLATALSSNGFKDLGVPPLMGRGLLPSDAVDGQEAELVTVLSYKFWQEHFLADPDIVGKPLELDHQKYRIVGVAAPRFTWYNPQIWIPLSFAKDPSRRYVIDFFLKPGITHSAANAALQPLIEQFAKESPKQFPERFQVRVEGLNEWVTRDMSGTLYLLFGAVMLLLAIGCGNVSILFLARGTARQQELSVRAALGASRARLVKQLLTESLLLSLVGAGFGILLSYAILAAMKTVLPRYAFAPEVVVSINLPVLCFSAVVAVFTGVLFGLWPAFRLSQNGIGTGMQISVRRATGTVMGRRTHQALIAGQIALTLLLLTSAGAATTGFLKIIKAHLGYESHNVLTVPIPLAEKSYPTWTARANYYQQLEDTLSQIPSVSMTAVSSNAVPPHGGWDTPIALSGRVTKKDLTASLNLVSPRYFPLLHIPLLQGRLWNNTENHNCAHVIVVNRSFAQRYFPNGDAIGRLVKLPKIENRPPSQLTAPDIANSWLAIIGIVADSRNQGLRDPVKPAIYAPFTLAMGQFTQILVRSGVGAPQLLINPVRKQLARLNPDQQSFEIEDLDAVISDSPEWQQEHLVAWIFSVFSILALALAAAGLYSVVSYTVAQRTGEFGIRMALGARQSDILRTVFASTMISVVSGIVAGLALALLFSGLVEKWAGGNARNPLTLVAGLALLALVAAVACLIPARFATKIDPMTALRFQ
jgi:predicted permease